MSAIRGVIADDGVGGPTSAGGGFGFVGLADRVEIPQTALADPAGGQPS
ncbi:hypothetical protein [Mycobacterium antarcticum]|nr:MULTISPECIES: hypothetical protein [unclassified Mycolicibacterium]